MREGIIFTLPSAARVNAPDRGAVILLLLFPVVLFVIHMGSVRDAPVASGFPALR